MKSLKSTLNEFLISSLKDPSLIYNNIEKCLFKTLAKKTFLF